MVSIHIKNRSRNHCGKKREVPGVEIAAGEDKLNPPKKFVVEKVPYKLAFFIGDNKNLYPSQLLPAL
jgi:hypothetical protein